MARHPIIEEKLRVVNLVLARLTPCPECGGRGAIELVEDDTTVDHVCRVCQGGRQLAWVERDGERVTTTATEATAMILSGAAS